MKAKKYNTAQTKNQLNEIINQVHATKNPAIIEKRGEDIAVIIDIETYREKLGKGLQTETEDFLKQLLSFHEAVLQERNGKWTGDSVELLRELREEES